MKRIHIIAVLIAAGVLAAGALVLGQSKVSPQAIASSVTRTPDLMERAWRLPVAATFNRQLTWQSNASRCGPAALANAYRSMGDAATTEGKVLARTGWCWTGVCILGLTLDELAEVARVNKRRNVTVLRDLSEEQFLEHLRRSNDLGRRYIVNFSRERIFGAGVGHHSPIGGYLEPEDLVFVLDVNADYQPWLVERKRLYLATDTFDGPSKRGAIDDRIEDDLPVSAGAHKESSRADEDRIARVHKAQWLATSRDRSIQSNHSPATQTTAVASSGGVNPGS